MVTSRKYEVRSTSHRPREHKQGSPAVKRGPHGCFETRGGARRTKWSQSEADVGDWLGTGDDSARHALQDLQQPLRLSSPGVPRRRREPARTVPSEELGGTSQATDGGREGEGIFGRQALAAAGAAQQGGGFAVGDTHEDGDTVGHGLEELGGDDG